MNAPKPNPLELAKQGNSLAIAFLINRSLQPKGITAKTILRDGCLQVLLEADQIPSKEVLAPFVLKGMKSLEVGSIYKLKVYGREVGKTNLSWSQEFELSNQVASSPNRFIDGQLKKIDKKENISTSSSTLTGRTEKDVDNALVNTKDETTPVETPSVKQSCLGCLTLVFLIVGAVYIFGLITGNRQHNSPTTASINPTVEKQEVTDDLNNLTLKVATWNAELAAYRAMVRGSKVDANDEQLIQLAGLAMSDVLARETEAVREQALKDATIEVVKTIKIAQAGDAEATEKRVRSRFEQAVKEYGGLITQTLN